MSNIHPIIDRYTKELAPGRLDWIGLRPERKADMVEVVQTLAIAGLGLDGDRRIKGKVGSKRQVTLIGEENLDAIASILNIDPVNPSVLRRNLVVSGINLNVLRGQRFRIGSAEFEGTEPCHPCKRMEDALGKGGFAAMFGHGGLCARVINDGEIRLGDQLTKC